MIGCISVGNAAKSATKVKIKLYDAKSETMRHKVFCMAIQNPGNRHFHGIKRVKWNSLPGCRRISLLHRDNPKSIQDMLP